VPFAAQEQRRYACPFRPARPRPEPAFRLQRRQEAQAAASLCAWQAQAASVPPSTATVHG